MSAVPMISARRAGGEDVAVLSTMLARAFDDDPLSLYLFGSPRRRAAGLARFFALQMRSTYLRHGEVWTTADRAGAALWAPPAMPRPGAMDLVRIVPVLPYLSIWGRKTPDVIRLLSAYERARPRQEHWYLGTLGTDPDRQGCGVGSTLLRIVLDRLDAGGLPAYLESSKEKNISFYARHGFEVTGEIVTPDGPTLWLMWRTPRPLTS
ncbi:MAG TPA: GNAT family N-acetyltransferase [Acidimicrobiales bacterium]|nr:GNAT family N-acetyltransferase [Acidimicrobiales bacterium]